MIERVEFNDFPPDEVRLPWCAWLEHHGIEPDVIPVPGWIERRVETRQIAYLAYVTDEHGNIQVNEDRTDALREVRVAQLEAVPSPFPTAAAS